MDHPYIISTRLGGWQTNLMMYTLIFGHSPYPLLKYPKVFYSKNYQLLCYTITYGIYLVIMSKGIVNRTNQVLQKIYRYRLAPTVGIFVKLLEPQPLPLFGISIQLSGLLFKGWDQDWRGHHVTLILLNFISVFSSVHQCVQVCIVVHQNIS